tara:strand:- start:16 stop:465 length:450 start_codon:yes stop_codon:yes gene_type:complete
MAENRVKRDHETRDTKTRKRHWVKPDVLSNPEPQDGYEFRWVRIATLGVTDATNVSSKLREGWEPVKAEDHPEFALTDTDERFKGNVLQGGLLLCKAPEELVNERNDYYENQTRQQMNSVDNNLMRENDPRMPLFNERTTKVTNFGKGT